MNYKDMTESEVIDLLIYADDNYHNGISIMSDSEYDKIKDYAEKIYPNNTYFKTVGSPIKKNEKVDLPYILGSLKKCKAGDEDKNISKWLSKYNPQNKVFISAKLDGASCYIEVNNGKLIRAYTRGNGTEGFDITNKVRKFLKITTKEHIEVRGEILWKGNEYEQYNFSNRRNSVSGIINSDDGKYSEKLTFIAHELIYPQFRTERTRIEFLYSNGFEIPETRCMNFSEISEEKLIDLLKIFKNYYKDIIDIDGLVLTKNDSTRENTYYPENKIAFKVNDEASEGVVDYIEWNTTRTGKIVPVVILKEKLLLSGAFVERVTAHNAKFILDNKIGNGSKILVMRSGEVIPYISGIVTQSQNFQLINKCPCCEKELKWSETEVDLICTNKECSEQSFFKTENFVKVMEMEGFSVQSLKNLGIKNIFELYEIDEKYISSKEGFGKKSAEKIINQIRNSLINVDPSKFIAALGIEGLGIKNSQKVVEYLSEKKCENIVESFFQMKPEEFLNITGFGEKMTYSIINERKESEIIYNFLKDRKGITFKRKEKKNVSQSNINGKFIVLTGGYKIGRNELISIIENNGGIVQNSVNTKTNILVCEDINSNSSKMKKARELTKTKKDFIIITYDEFMETLN